MKKARPLAVFVLTLRLPFLVFAQETAKKAQTLKAAPGSSGGLLIQWSMMAMYRVRPQTSHRMAGKIALPCVIIMV